MADTVPTGRDDPASYPEGVGRREVAHAGRGLSRHASPVSLLVLGGILLAALLGLFGGGSPRTLVADAPAARLTIVTPETLRNGEFFEMRVEVVAKRPLEKPVLAVAPGLWKQITVNSQFPDPKEQGYEGGAFRFEYGKLDAGKTLLMKVDGQINPPLFLGTAGTITLLDGDAKLAELPVRIRVLP